MFIHMHIHMHILIHMHGHVPCIRVSHHRCSTYAGWYNEHCIQCDGQARDVHSHLYRQETRTGRMKRKWRRSLVMGDKKEEYVVCADVTQRKARNGRKQVSYLQNEYREKR